jgi:hypothetical protein
MRTKPNDWFDPASKRVAYGVDVLIENEWCHDADETGKPRLYATPEREISDEPCFERPNLRMVG